MEDEELISNLLFFRDQLKYFIKTTNEINTRFDIILDMLNKSHDTCINIDNLSCMS